MKGFKRVLICVFGLAIALPVAWGAPLPFGALDEVQPSKPVTKKEKPTPLPAPVSTSAPAVSLSASGYRVGQELKDCDVCPVLIVLPKGEYKMGSPASELGHSEDEGPQHRVKIDYGLAVGKYEVTQREWQAVMGGNPSDFKGKDLPVEHVSPTEAREYVKKLNDRTGKKFKYRLLSEAEWEYAARAGTITPFSTGQTISTAQANFNGNYTYNGSDKGENRKKTTKVGSLTPNAWGIYDMHGNVSEWVEDCLHVDYKGAPANGRAWGSSDSPSCEEFPFSRGGSWNDKPEVLRSAFRSSSGTPGSDDYYIVGLRLARTF